MVEDIVMDYRNAKYLANGNINCEIDHPIYGWIPFTCDPNDTGTEFDVAALYAALNADPDTAAYAPEPPTPLAREQLMALRAAAYQKESDPLFFKAQRGEAEMGEWLALVGAIKSRFPYPSE